jgi:hypothetical protein
MEIDSVSERLLGRADLTLPAGGAPRVSPYLRDERICFHS